MTELLRLGSCKSGAVQEYCRFVTFLSFLCTLRLPRRLPGVRLAGEMELFFPLFDFPVAGQTVFPPLAVSFSRRVPLSPSP